MNRRDELEPEDVRIAGEIAAPPAAVADPVPAPVPPPIVKTS